MFSLKKVEGEKEVDELLATDPPTLEIDFLPAQERGRASRWITLVIIIHICCATLCIIFAVSNRRNVVTAHLAYLYPIHHITQKILIPFRLYHKR